LANRGYQIRDRGYYKQKEGLIRNIKGDKYNYLIGLYKVETIRPPNYKRGRDY